MASDKPVGALLAGLEVLRQLSAADGPQRLSTIAGALALTPSTVRNILHTLAQQGYVRFDPNTRLYAMDMGPLGLFRGAATKAVLDGVAERLGATVSLWCRLPAGRMMLAMQANLAHAPAIRLRPGQSLPLSCEPAGRVMAAFAMEADGDDAAGRDIRRRGWAEDVGDRAWTVAAPVLDRRGVAMLALEAVMFRDEYDAQRRIVAIEELACALAFLSSGEGRDQVPVRGGKVSMPPSTGSVTPVIQRASGPQR